MIDIFIPLDIIRLILSKFYFLETHIDISGISRYALFEQLWRFARLKLDNNKSIIDEFIVGDTGGCFEQQQNGKSISDEKTFISSYKNVPIFVNILQKSNIIDVSQFNSIYGKDMGQYVVNIIKKWDNRPRFKSFVSFEHSTPELILSDREYKVLIRKRNSKITAAEGVIIIYGSIRTMVKITETYSVYFEIGTYVDLYTDQLALYNIK